MSRRLPAAPPGPSPRDPTPPAPPEDRPDPPVDDLGDLEDPDTTDALDDELLDPAAFPDDPEDPALAAALAAEAHTDLDTLPSLEVAEPEEDVDVPIDDPPLEDDLADLDAPDDLEMPILPWSTTVRLDGRPLPAVVDPGRARTVWLTPSAPAPTVTVALELAGRTLRLTVACSAEDSDPERVVLGRDVLAGRFLLRP